MLANARADAAPCTLANFLAASSRKRLNPPGSPRWPGLESDAATANCGATRTALTPEAEICSATFCRCSTSRVSVARWPWKNTTITAGRLASNDSGMLEGARAAGRQPAAGVAARRRDRLSRWAISRPPGRYLAELIADGRPGEMCSRASALNTLGKFSESMSDTAGARCWRFCLAQACVPRLRAEAAEPFSRTPNTCAALVRRGRARTVVAGGFGTRPG